MLVLGYSWNNSTFILEDKNGRKIGEINMFTTKDRNGKTHKKICFDFPPEIIIKRPGINENGRRKTNRACSSSGHE